MNLVEKAERYDRLAEIFKGTFFDGLLEIREEDFLDSDIPLGPDEEPFDELDDIEKMIFSLFIRRCNDIGQQAETLGLNFDDLNDLNLLFSDENFEGLMVFEEKLKKNFTDLNLKFPQDDWEYLLDNIENSIYLMDVLFYCVNYRQPETKERVFFIKSGFLIALQKEEAEEDEQPILKNLIWKSFFKN